MPASATLAVPTTREKKSLGGAIPLLAAWLMALAIMAMSTVPMTVSRIHDGTLVDNDDAMRLVQMRDWMNGQSWFDLTERRIDPPTGMLSHWPRLVELPMAGAIRGLGLFVDRDLAERIVVAVWPSVLLAGLVLALLIVAARVFAPPTLLAGAAIVALNPVIQFDFEPGRIDHHSAQLLLALVLAGASVAALVDKRAVAAVVAGIAGALSIAIGLEALPIVATGAALFGAAWIVQGQSARRIVGTFGASFAIGAPAFFALTIPPSRWTTSACDALSPPWVWLAAGGGLALFGLALLPQPTRILSRGVAAFAAAGAVVCIFALGWPHCLAGPYADVDPLVRALWLDHVGEANSVFSVALGNPALFLYFLVFPLLGTLALGLAALREGRSEPPLLILFAFSAMALGVALTAMRATPFAANFALFGWLYLFDRLLRASPDASMPRVGLLRAGLAVAVVIGALPFLWTVLGETAKPSAAVASEPANCGARADMAALAAAPPGLVLAPIRLGPRILVATGDEVLGAPYHRNNEGNRASLDMLLAAPGEAHRMVGERGVRYVAFCVGDPDLPHLEAYRAGSLLDGLVAGKIPGVACAPPRRRPDPRLARRRVTHERPPAPAPTASSST